MDQCRYSSPLRMAILAAAAVLLAAADGTRPVSGAAHPSPAPPPLRRISEPTQQLEVPDGLWRLATTSGRLVGYHKAGALVWDWEALDLPPQLVTGGGGLAMAYLRPNRVALTLHPGEDASEPIVLRDPTRHLPDKRFPLTGWSCNTLWGTANGKHCAAVLEGPSTVVDNVRHRRVRIGALIGDATSFIWINIPSDGEDALEVSDVAVSEDGRYLAGVGAKRGKEGWIVLVDTAESKVLWTCSPPGAPPLTSVVFSADSAIVYAACPDKAMVYPFDAASGKVRPRWRILPKEGEAAPAITRLAASSDPLKAGYVAAGTRSGKVYVWDAASGRAAFIITVGQASVEDVAFSPDMTHLATVSAKETQVQIWALTTEASDDADDADAADAHPADEAANTRAPAPSNDAPTAETSTAPKKAATVNP